MRESQLLQELKRKRRKVCSISHHVTSCWQNYKVLMHLTSQVVLTFSIEGNSCMRNYYLNHVYCAEMLFSKPFFFVTQWPNGFHRVNFPPVVPSFMVRTIGLSFERGTADATVSSLLLTSLNTELLSSTIVSVPKILKSSKLNHSFPQIQRGIIGAIFSRDL